MSVEIVKWLSQDAPVILPERFAHPGTSQS